VVSTAEDGLMYVH
jgi:hypothetical protein